MHSWNSFHFCALYGMTKYVLICALFHSRDSKCSVRVCVCAYYRRSAMFMVHTHPTCNYIVMPARVHVGMAVQCLCCYALPFPWGFLNHTLHIHVYVCVCVVVVVGGDKPTRLYNSIAVVIECNGVVYSYTGWLAYYWILVLPWETHGDLHTRNSWVLLPVFGNLYHYRC